MSMGDPLPSGVRAVAVLFALCGIYLGIAGLLMLFWPGVISMSAGAPLLFGLELSGAYMFLLMALVGIAIAWGLMRRVNLARRAAMLVAIAGIVMLVPPVSAAAAMVQPGALILGGLGVVVRVIVAWYLSRAETVQEFRSPSPPTRAL
jgi:hypothetical protein